MKLIKGTKANYNAISKTYTFEFSKDVQPKKVSSRMFPCLIGKNNFNSIGYAILERNRLIEFEEIDKYYTVRGAIAEHMVNNELRKQFKETQGVNLITKSFTPKQFKMYDQFDMSYKWGNDKFGGVCDIAVTSPEKFRCTVEVKSKSQSAYDYIVTKGKLPEEEVLQGMQLAVLSKVNFLIMAYVFFPPNIEKNLKIVVTPMLDVDKINVEEIMTNIGLKPQYVDFHFKRFVINTYEVQKQMDIAYDNLMRHTTSGSIPVIMFNDEERSYLDEFIGIDSRSSNGKIVVTENDLPF